MDKLSCLISFALYICAPTQYSFIYCVCLFVHILLNALYVYRKDKKYEIIGYNTIFSLSLILVTYVYPLFIYPIFPTFSLFSFSYNENVITKASAMVNLAYSFYVIGYMTILNKDKNTNLIACRKNFIFPTIISKSLLSLWTKVDIVLFLFIIGAGGLEMFYSQYAGDKSVHASGIFGFLWVFFQTYCILLTIINLRLNNRSTYIAIGLIMLILMAVGTRTLPLSFIILVTYSICIKKNLSLTKIAFIGISIFIALSLVGRFRLGNAGFSDISSTDIGLWAYLEDFIVCTRNQYVIYDYVQQRGTTLGVSSLGYILAIVPFAQSFVCALFGLSDADLRSESLTTKWESTETGLGTHIVGDVYLAFGMVGVVLLFYSLGYIVAKARREMFLGNWKGTIIYLVLVSGSMFMCRGSIFYCLKNIVWSLIIILLVRNYQTSKKHETIIHDTRDL